jgi:hypothetical protein
MRDMRRYFQCKSLQLAQEGVQVGGHRFDHDSIDTGFSVLLDFVEDCAGVALGARGNPGRLSHHLRGSH